MRGGHPPIPPPPPPSLRASSSSWEQLTQPTSHPPFPPCPPTSHLPCRCPPTSHPPCRCPPTSHPPCPPLAEFGNGTSVRIHLSNSSTEETVIPKSIFFDHNLFQSNILAFYIYLGLQAFKAERSIPIVAPPSNLQFIGSFNASSLH